MYEGPKVNHAELLRMRTAGMTMQQCADQFGVSKAAVWHRLNRKVSRRNKRRESKPCGCGCGHPVKPPRKYATRDCYFWVVVPTNADGSPKYAGYRHGQRIARHTVSAVFELLPGYVVHHEDRDCHNNTLENLWVFASHGDHMSYHRGGPRRPVWRGDGGPCGDW